MTKLIIHHFLDENDSQQAAEAMIQLYSQQQTALEESNDFENYDPSDFLMKKDDQPPEPQFEPEEPAMQQVQEQMQYQQEYYETSIQDGAGGDEVSQQNFYSSFSQQSFSTADYNFQQPSQDDLSQSQPTTAIASGGGLDDLDISDSDDDDDEPTQASTSQTQQQADTSKEDDDGLWF